MSGLDYGNVAYAKPARRIPPLTSKRQGNKQKGGVHRESPVLNPQAAAGIATATTGSTATDDQIEPGIKANMHEIELISWRPCTKS